MSVLWMVPATMLSLASLHFVMTLEAGWRDVGAFGRWWATAWLASSMFGIVAMTLLALGGA